VSGLVPVMHLVLPVGISFYTFKAMSYVIDVLPGRGPAHAPLHRLHVLRGLLPRPGGRPIIRYAAMEEQMRLPPHTADKFARGVAFFAFGWPRRS
jgi:alginate O-acetyltransferase complex protein AlgI